MSNPQEDWTDVEIKKGEVDFFFEGILEFVNKVRTKEVKPHFNKGDKLEASRIDITILFAMSRVLAMGLATIAYGSYTDDKIKETGERIAEDLKRLIAKELEKSEMLRELPIDEGKDEKEDKDEGKDSIWS